MVQVNWTREALASLAAIRRYVARFDPRAGDRLASRLWAAGQSLSDFPNRGRPGSEGTRELPNVPPYVIVYEVSGDRVFILAIRHGRQRPGP